MIDPTKIDWVGKNSTESHAPFTKTEVAVWTIVALVMWFISITLFYCAI